MSAEEPTVVPALVGRALCRERGEHRVAESAYTGLLYCLDCDWEQYD